MTDLEKVLLENRRMREALMLIRDWKLPEVKSRDEMVPYAVAYGSNGARDYMRNVAEKAMQPVEGIR